MKDETIERKDWFLQSIVNIANTSSTEENNLNIVLCVNGFLVSGEIISGKDFFDLYLKPTEEEQKENQLIKVYSTLEEKFYSEKSDEEDPFVHLKNVKFSQNNITSNENIIWRIRISQVSGYSLSNMDVNKES